MNKNLTSTNGYIHLYNPKKEGIGGYDIHYINAKEKQESIKRRIRPKQNERFVA
tara:strand:- start:344 stop:505 length:162 start_codon:yes stop_codon:yes gene_type:complete